MHSYNPVSTYRVQFNHHFTLKKGLERLPYWHRLGIKTIYASPIFKATTGSLHGYDVTSPLAIHPEIGTLEELEQLIKALHDLKMGWIQDIVPNHMAFSTENKWIYDILEKGVDSAYSHFFDIDWDHPDKRLRHKLLLPFFATPLETLIAHRDLQVIFHSSGFKLTYGRDQYPISPATYPTILNGYDPEPIPASISAFLEGGSGSNRWDQRLAELHMAYTADPVVRKHIQRCVSRLNNDSNRLRALIAQQHYLPACWKETGNIINFRRFFFINELICLNVHEKEVFDIYHQMIGQWVENRWFDGLRIDHIDGLLDPTRYLENLRRLCGDSTYICVEKMVQIGEQLPLEWPVQGSTGYEFLAAVNNLLTCSQSAVSMLDHYQAWSDHQESYETTIYRTKRFILHHHLNGELDKLVRAYGALMTQRPEKWSVQTIRKAIAELLVYFPVYKIYRVPSVFTPQDRRILLDAFDRAGQRGENADIAPALEQLHSTLTASDSVRPTEMALIDRFFRLCMLITGPLMAKGLEDTAFYSYVPFLAHNEVGDSPGYFGIGRDRFHQKMVAQQKNAPLTMNCTTTHDTNRGEDARARLNVLSDIADKWIIVTSKWRSLNAPYKHHVGGKEIPTSNDEYLIYQSLCGHLPMHARCDDTFMARFNAYIIKALREAKINTSWNHIDQHYEGFTLEFIRKILSPANPFREKYLTFMKAIIPHGIVNSLTQIILKYLTPGVPDTYQGAENWDLNFVDPDNRREVNYDRHIRNLNNIVAHYRENAPSLLARLWRQPENGKIKQLVSYVCLQQRKAHECLFLRGSYEPLKVEGEHQDRILAFYRRYHDAHLLVVVPLNTAGLPAGYTWKNTRVLLPDFAPPKWEEKLSKTIFETIDSIGLDELFDIVPFAILAGLPFQPERRAGILMHISSLPGPYGVGDFGEPAHQFIDFLNHTQQRYWQILPLNICDKIESYSPYSSISAFALNPLFIDPKQLCDLGLIHEEDLPYDHPNPLDTADYDGAEKIKTDLISKAHLAFQRDADGELKQRYQAFLAKESSWLDDFALFTAIRKSFDNLPWNRWPSPYRDRDKMVLRQFVESHQEEIDYYKFSQFLASQQWLQLKSYANRQGIRMIGDIPIYVSYDSADVWAQPEQFHLNADKTIKTVAGVPPDYFDPNGQLWGLPIFDWHQMAQDGYAWWLMRLEKNLQWFDLLRLDHFRAFAAYWEVPADHRTAKKGRWVAGPGEKLFDAIQKRFPRMPFVAEDLGEIDQDVYDLRDRYQLPGMKVVQFGFGPNMPFLHNLPSNHSYNCIAYTGTHDNNTMKGWFRTEAGKQRRRRFRQFSGVSLNEQNCHMAFIRLTYASVSKLAIIPMQDWLGLDESARMNVPSTTKGNWLWRMLPDAITPRLERKMQKMVKTFGRY